MSLNLKEMIEELSLGEQARAKVPELERQLSVVGSEMASLQDHNQQLELRAKNREDQISSLLERIRNAEKDRDDALMASLEVEDKLKSFRGTVDKFSSAVASALSGVGAANALLDPPKPVQSAPAAEGVKEPEENMGNASQSSGPSSQDQNSQASQSGQSGSSNADPAGFGTNPTWPTDTSSSQGESVTGPTADLQTSEAGKFDTGNAGAGTVTTQEHAAGDTSPPVDTRPWWIIDEERKAADRAR